MNTDLTWNIKKLGFGLMRLPVAHDAIDIEQLKQMVDLFLEQGFTYFDTAYVYHGGKSEVAIKEALVDRYPRERFQLATKMPFWVLKEPKDMQRVVDEQLERTNAGYFDFYLLHSLQANIIAKIDSFNGWGFAKTLKEKGIAKHIGFSFHDTPELLDEILTKHTEMEFVQLQINYGDWENDKVQSKRCYEIARKHHKPLIIMEPVKGGSLAVLTPEIRKIFTDANPNVSVASWALRFAASLDGVITVLSGMSTLEQMRDNLHTMRDFTPLSDSERDTINQVVAELRKTPTIPCTGCKYCVKGCPKEIPIPNIFDVLNTYKMYRNLDPTRGEYRLETHEHKASDCIKCGQCESVCPQHIEVIAHLKEACKLFE